MKTKEAMKKKIKNKKEEEGTKEIRTEYITEHRLFKNWIILDNIIVSFAYYIL